MVKQVVSYRDDVFVWVYLDQVDRVIRYEAFVIGYDDFGEPSTLDFVIEEGVLDNAHEVPLFWELLREFKEHAALVHPGDGISFTLDGRLVTAPSLLHFYRNLTRGQLERLHSYFADQEEQLKESRRTGGFACCGRWVTTSSNRFNLEVLGYSWRRQTAEGPPRQLPPRVSGPVHKPPIDEHVSRGRAGRRRPLAQLVLDQIVKLSGHTSPSR